MGATRAVTCSGFIDLPFRPNDSVAATPETCAAATLVSPPEFKQEATLDWCRAQYAVEEPARAGWTDTISAPTEHTAPDSEQIIKIDVPARSRQTTDGLAVV